MSIQISYLEELGFLVLILILNEGRYLRWELFMVKRNDMILL